MINDKINSSDIKGWITIYGIDKQGNKHILVDRKNTLVTNAKTIIANVLGAVPSYALDTITCLKASAPLSAKNVSYSFPASDKVKFTALFDEASFNDTLDEVQLSSAAGGQFSSVTGLSVFKGNTLQLSIEWLLTIV